MSKRSTSEATPSVPVAFIAWGAVPGRSAEIAGALGGEARCFVSPRLQGRRFAPVRYVIAAVRTMTYLVRRRPQAVIVTNPPVFAALVALPYTLITGVPLLLDSHPTSFGAKEHVTSQRLLPIHRWLARRAVSTLVTTDDWVRTVEGWGARSDIVHEAPIAWTASSDGSAAGGRPTILFVGTFAGDEPVSEVLAAAASLPHADFVVTGDLRRCPEDRRAKAPGNVRFPGFVPPEEYRQLVEAADVILTLTTEPTSIMRAAYEAIYAGKPLVTTDWPALREVFPYAVHVANTATEISAGLHDALACLDELHAVADEARSVQLGRWKQQLDVLSDLIDGAREHNCHSERCQAS